MKIETDLAHAGLNSDHVALKTTNSSKFLFLLELKAASPTSRSQT